MHDPGRAPGFLFVALRPAYDLAYDLAYALTGAAGGTA